MSDAKYFQRGKTQEILKELTSLDKKDHKSTKRKNILKRIIANMTIGNDMSPLFNDVLNCININSLEIKKMVYLYLITYARHKPDLAVLYIDKFLKDTEDSNPLIRALALRTLSYINVQEVFESICLPVKRAMADKDPYVCKTAALCVPKLFAISPQLVIREEFIPKLRDLLAHSNAMVVANAVIGLTEISERSRKNELQLSNSMANKLLTALDECNEWGQAYILGSLIYTVPQTHEDAELLADRITPRLQHANSAIVLTTIRVLVFLTSYIKNDSVVEGIFKKIGPPIATLLNSPPEIQFLALRNILILIQRDSKFLKDKDLNLFFCKYNDPIYVKMAKLQILHRLASSSNIHTLLPELTEYAQEVDVMFVRKSVRAIGRCAIKIESAADACVEALVELIKTKINYIVQEAIIVVKDIFRRYSNKYESVISIICENLENLDEPESKAALIWIIGQSSDRIENASDLLNQFCETLPQDPPEVQLSLLTAIVKLFIRRPSAGQELLPKILKFATEESENPDLRDRGYVYWRLLTFDPVKAKSIILAEKPPILIDSDSPHRALLDILLLNISTLSSVYRKPPSRILSGALDTRFVRSPAFVYRNYGSNGILSSLEEVTINKDEQFNENIEELDNENIELKNGYMDDFLDGNMNNNNNNSSLNDLVDLDLLSSPIEPGQSEQSQAIQGLTQGINNLNIGNSSLISTPNIMTTTNLYQQNIQANTMQHQLMTSIPGGTSAPTAYDNLLAQQRQGANILVNNGSVNTEYSQNSGVNPFARALEEQKQQAVLQQQQYQGLTASINGEHSNVMNYLVQSSGKVSIDPFAVVTGILPDANSKTKGNPFGTNTDKPLQGFHPDAQAHLSINDFTMTSLVPEDDKDYKNLPILLDSSSVGNVGLQIKGELRVRDKFSRQDVVSVLPPQLQQGLLDAGGINSLLDYELVLLISNSGLASTFTRLSLLFNRNPIGIQPLILTEGYSLISALAVNPKHAVPGLVPGGKTLVKIPLYVLPQARPISLANNKVILDNFNLIQIAIKVDNGLSYFNLNIPPFVRGSAVIPRSISMGLGSPNTYTPLGISASKVPNTGFSFIFADEFHGGRMEKMAFIQTWQAISDVQELKKDIVITSTVANQTSIIGETIKKRLLSSSGKDTTPPEAKITDTIRRILPIIGGDLNRVNSLSSFILGLIEKLEIGNILGVAERTVGSSEMIYASLTFSGCGGNVLVELNISEPQGGNRNVRVSVRSFIPGNASHIVLEAISNYISIPLSALDGGAVSGI